MCPTVADPAESILGETWTIIVAGGSGLRFGARKQFADLHGESVVQHSVDSAATASSGIVVVIPSDMADLAISASDQTDLLVVAGGATRSESVRAGIAALPDSCEVVLVHDAARPLATSKLFERIVDAVRGGAGAVIPAVPIADTIRRRTGGVVDRADLLAVQTPQGFNADVLRAAHSSGEDATDDATLVEATGCTVQLIDGEVENRKITDPIDLVTAAAVVRSRQQLREST